MLRIEIGGTVAGSQFDRLNVAGDLSLDGKLEIALINGFAPSPGQTFDILNWGTLVGAFSSVVLPSLPGLSWDTSQMGSGVISVAASSPTLDGDYNDNGAVDAADYVMWQKLKGTNADMENDPNPVPIDGDQYNTWRTHFGESGSGSGGESINLTVPEPSSFAMVLGVSLACFACRKRAVVRS